MRQEGNNLMIRECPECGKETVRVIVNTGWKDGPDPEMTAYVARPDEPCGECRRKERER